MSATDIVDGWASTSEYVVPPTTTSLPMPSMTVSGATRPSSIAPAIVMTLLVEPGS